MSYGVQPPAFEAEWALKLWASSVARFAASLSGFVTVTSDYSVKEGVFLVRVDATAGDVTVTLPAASDHPGRPIYVKKIDASANDAIISAADEIDGSATVSTATQYEAIGVMSVGTTWDRID